MIIKAKSKKRLGDILVSNGLITEEQLKEALEAQKGKEKLLGDVLVELGFLTSEEITGIKEELLNPNYSIQDIANHFKCDRSTISDINQGKRYSKENEKYPIRDSFHKRKS